MAGADWTLLDQKSKDAEWKWIELKEWMPTRALANCGEIKCLAADPARCWLYALDHKGWLHRISLVSSTVLHPWLIAVPQLACFTSGTPVLQICEGYLADEGCTTSANANRTDVMDMVVEPITGNLIGCTNNLQLVGLSFCEDGSLTRTLHVWFPIEKARWSAIVCDSRGRWIVADAAHPKIYRIEKGTIRLLADRIQGRIETVAVVQSSWDEELPIVEKKQCRAFPFRWPSSGRIPMSIDEHDNIVVADSKHGLLRITPNGLVTGLYPLDLENHTTPHPSICCLSGGWTVLSLPTTLEAHRLVGDELEQYVLARPPSALLSPVVMTPFHQDVFIYDSCTKHIQRVRLCPKK